MVMAATSTMTPEQLDEEIGKAERDRDYHEKEADYWDKQARWLILAGESMHDQLENFKTQEVEERCKADEAQKRLTELKKEKEKRLAAQKKAEAEKKAKEEAARKKAAQEAAKKAAADKAAREATDREAARQERELQQDIRDNRMDRMLERHENIGERIHEHDDRVRDKIENMLRGERDS